jgi:hypothetical protein
MTKVNIKRVILGGLLAGLVLNVGEGILNGLILGDEWSAIMAESGMIEFTTMQMVSFTIITFLLGMVLIWLYAAIRPRFGPGLKTAVIAGIAMWLIAWLLVGASFITAGMYPTGLMVTSIIWGLFEVPIAAVAGAWLYQES